MARTKLNPALGLTAAILLVTSTAIIVTTCDYGLFRRSAKGRAKFRLPLGQITPVIGLGSGHGVIVASDGSLWSRGENTDGWPVAVIGPGN
jgi:hypothetical protein